MESALRTADLSWQSPAVPAFDIVAIAASAGGFPAFSTVLAALPPDFPAAILLLQHRGADGPDLLPCLLRRRTALKVKPMDAGEQPRPGTVYVARGGRHMLMDREGALLLGTAKTYGSVCPSADQLFSSVAQRHGPRAIAVVLSGMGRDGAAGVREVRMRGGVVIAQSSASCVHDSMPRSAVETRKVDLVLPAAEIGFALRSLCSTTL